MITLFFHPYNLPSVLARVYRLTEADRSVIHRIQAWMISTLAIAIAVLGIALTALSAL